jgi:DNA (cytosine-5)-methyltransferase 1
LKIKYIDLFAGIGGFRLGFERACANLQVTPSCVFTSEIKANAVDTYRNNFPGCSISGDITKIDASNIPKFDVLLAGFPCQAFSSAGTRKGFKDTRGTLFFDIERIIKHHMPSAFILENVEGLIKHDLQNKSDSIGKTLTIILNNLRKCGYKVNWELLNSADFGLAQNRKRIFIVGTKKTLIPLDNFKKKHAKIKSILEKGAHDGDELTNFSKILFKKYKADDLYGKAIKDRRGGEDNIHSWDLGLKGKTNKYQRQLLGELLKARRQKKWAKIKGIQWSDGMPLTEKEIQTFCDIPNMTKNLEDLNHKGYLAFRHPKDIIETSQGVFKKLPREDLEKGYDLVTGKLSFEVSNILDAEGLTPALVATDASKLAVIEDNKLRRLLPREMARLFGFPESFEVNDTKNSFFDLFGNSIAVNVVERVAENLVKHHFLKEKYVKEIRIRAESCQLSLL